MPTAHAHPRRTMAALCVGTALSALNSGMIAVALATLRRDFTLDLATVTWVITTYYLASAALQPLMGRIADRHGPRRLFTFGMAVIIVTGALTPFAPAFWIVCVARILFAVGMATAFPSATAMLRAISEKSGVSASKMIGRIQTIDTGTAAIGPIIGGVLITQFGWQAIFWINVPLAAIALVGVLLLAPADGIRRSVPIRETLVESDIPGILAFSASIIAILTFLLGLPSNPRWWLLAVVVVMAALFVWRELHYAHPFIDLRLLAANTPLLRVYACFLLVNLLFYTVLFGLPPFLEENGGYSADVVGALMIPLAAFTVFLSPLVEKLIDRRGLRFALILGGAGSVIAAAIMGVLAASTAPLVVILVGSALGIPYCVLLIALTQALYVAAPAGQRGQAAGLFQTTRCLAGISSTVIVGISFSTGTTSENWSLMATVVTVLAAAYLILVIVWRARPRAETVTG
ncbi:MFS transporter [Rathayibacter soli]|uniref:MFS transporter n=1 Tax=Rathayibacter soli TaxID=3144168 RepID=UPI0027E3D98B|nr:MFS transporter [Glaciibacter superstes]